MARFLLSFLLVFSFVLSLGQVPEEIKPKELLKRFELLEHVGSTTHCHFVRVHVAAKGWDDASPIPGPVGMELVLVFSSERPSGSEFAIMPTRARMFELQTRKSTLEVKTSEGAVFEAPTEGYVYLCLNSPTLEQRLQHHQTNQD